MGILKKRNQVIDNPKVSKIRLMNWVKKEIERERAKNILLEVLKNVNKSKDQF